MINDLPQFVIFEVFRACGVNPAPTHAPAYTPPVEPKDGKTLLGAR